MGSLDQDGGSPLAFQDVEATDKLIRLMAKARETIEGTHEDGSGLPPMFIEGLPDELCQAAGEALSQHGWFQVAPGIELLMLDVPGSSILASGGSAYIVRMEPGCEGKAHRHEGNEFNLVLEGAMHDDGKVQARGHVSHMHPGSLHPAAFASEEGCVALTVLTGPIVFVEDEELSH